jgi:hypothetical protein
MSTVVYLQALEGVCRDDISYIFYYLYCIEGAGDQRSYSFLFCHNEASSIF